MAGSREARISLRLSQHFKLAREPVAVLVDHSDDMGSRRDIQGLLMKGRGRADVLIVQMPEQRCVTVAMDRFKNGSAFLLTQIDYVPGSAEERFHLLARLAE